MAIFMRLDRRAGDSPIERLLTSPDSNGQENSGNQIVLTDSDVTSVDGALSSSQEQNYAALSFGRTQLVKTGASPRQVVFTFSCGDVSGLEQDAIKRFFTWDRPIQVTDSQRNLIISIYIVSIDDSFFSGNDQIQITAQTVYNDITTEIRETIVNADFGSDTWTGADVDVKNNRALDSVIEATVDANAVADFKQWQSDLVWTLSRKDKDDTDGRTERAYRWHTGDEHGDLVSKQWAVSSLDECLEGTITILPDSTAYFWKIPAGGEYTVHIGFGGESGGGIAISAFHYKVEQVWRAPTGQSDLDK